MGVSNQRVKSSNLILETQNLFSNSKFSQILFFSDSKQTKQYLDYVLL